MSVKKLITFNIFTRMRDAKEVVNFTHFLCDLFDGRIEANAIQ